MTSATPGSRRAPTWVPVLLVALGVLLVVVAVIYFAEPADKLPGLFPGHARNDTHHHLKHGIAALVIAIIAFAGAWMTTGKRQVA
jgi:amino acid permease